MASSPAEPVDAVPELAGDATAPRRWDAAALADFDGLSTTVACECPRHVAELLIQLSHFEAYSAQCEHRSPEDAELHAYLRGVAASSRAHLTGFSLSALIGLLTSVIVLSLVHHFFKPYLRDLI